MSHSIGRMVSITPIVFGPGGVLTHGFVPQDALTGGKPRFVILHFTSMTFPAGSSLRVNVGYGGPGYDVDVFTTDGDAWTRPIDPTPGPIQITWTGAAGGATLAEYASGEPITTGVPGTDTGRTTNPDVFLRGLLPDGTYQEPVFETRGRCGSAFDWENMVCGPNAAEAAAGKAVCMIVSRETAEGLVVSTCSGTLIGPDLILSAEHCCADTDDIDAKSGSVTFDFQTNCDGTRPATYNAVFHKIKRVVNRGTGTMLNVSPPVSVDWAVLQIETPPGGLGIAPRVLRSIPAMTGEKIFAIHHPNATVKKIQRSTLPGTDVSSFSTDLDVCGGSSGSALFDIDGKIIGAAAHSAAHCFLSYCPATDVLAQLANPPAPPTPFDVMLVMDRSGSMDDPGTSMPGATKMDEAHQAADLFVNLVRNNQGDRLGMVSFSNDAKRPPDTPLGTVNAAHKTALTNAIDNLHPDAATSIGDGLKAGMESLAPGANQRAILLMTDGLQNHGVTIPQGEASMADTKLFIVGFGQEGDLDGPGMTALARRHNGIFNRANDGLNLKKFFSLCFGNIFEAGTLVDPDRILRADEKTSAAVPFSVCEEERITAVIGWNDPSQTLRLSLRTPANTNVAGVEEAAGATWHFLRVPLPHNGERAGTWHWQVGRIIGGGEFPPPQADVKYFVHIVAAGGPRLIRIPITKRIYTGDPVNPLVALKYANGTSPNGKVQVEIVGPDVAIGRLMSEARLDPPRTSGDAVDAFHNTLQRIERTRGPLPTRTVTVDLFDDGDHEDGAWEPDGIYGNVLTDLTRFEGTYSFHARATFGEGCVSTREAMWSIAVEPSIDPGKTTVQPFDGGLKITPADVYGNPIGPGRGDGFDVSPLPGVTFTGPVHDNGDGSYSVPATWDSGTTPGVVVSQPERPPVVLAPPCPPAEHKGCARFWWLWLVLAAVLFILLIICWIR
jgi:hypothetical protein